jgi:hypothetical protein
MLPSRRLLTELACIPSVDQALVDSWCVIVRIEVQSCSKGRPATLPMGQSDPVDLILN